MDAHLHNAGFDHPSGMKPPASAIANRLNPVKA